MISKDTIEEIRTKVNLLDVVERYISLKKRGRNYFGLCPFHAEKTPSFSVSEEKGIFKCFGCGKSGDVITFFASIERLGYYEAVKELCEQYGIKIKYVGGEEEFLPRSEKELLQSTNKAIALLAHQYLYKNNYSNVLKYLKEERGINEEYLKSFLLGFVPEDTTNFTKEIIKMGFREDILEKTGFVSKKEKDFYSIFKNRILFPLFDTRQWICGFAGRIYGEPPTDAPKFINSPESIIYNKSEYLYALNLARQKIVELGFSIIVEGYIDCILLHQYGIKNTVAIGGTSLTVYQVLRLRRLSDTTIIIFDSDKSGLESAFRAVGLFIEGGAYPYVLVLPEGEDPDTFVKKNGTDGFIDYLNKNKMDFVQFSVNYIYQPTKELSKRYQILEKIIKHITCIGDPETKDMYIWNLSKFLGISRNDISAIGKKILLNEKQKKKQTNSESIVKTFISPKKTWEEELLMFILNKGHLQVNSETLFCYLMRNLLDEIQKLNLTNIFNDHILQEIFNYCLEWYQRGETLPPSYSVLKNLLSPDKHYKIDEWISTEFENKTPTLNEEMLTKLANEILSSFKLESLQKKENELLKLLNETKDENKHNTILNEYIIIKQEQKKTIEKNKLIKVKFRYNQ